MERDPFSVPQKPSGHPTKLGPYSIVKEIARGAMGVVYLGKTPQGNLVAIKVILSGSRTSLNVLERFEREVQVVKQLQHPHIVRLLDYGKEGKREYLAMEYVDGESLQSRIERGPLLLKEALGVAIALAEGIDYAHEKDIIHRDLKPANILLTSDGVPKISDFGLARDLKEDSYLTKTGAMVGSPAYMSPEQVEGKTGDKRSDVYALGVILFEMLVGSRPYEGSGAGMVYAQILHGPVPSLKALNPSIPIKVEKICQKAMAKKKGQRYSRALDFALELEDYLEGGSGIREKTKVASGKYQPSQKPLGLIGLFLVLGIFVGFLFLNWFQTESRTAPRRKGPKDNSLPGPKKILPPKKIERVYKEPLLPREIEETVARGHYWKGFKKLNSFLEKNPTHARALINRARCLLYLGEVDKAREDLEKLSPFLSQTLEVQILWGAIWYSAKEDYRVQKVLDQWRGEQKPAGLFLLRYLMERRRNNNLKALECIKKAITLAPKNWYYCYIKNHLIFEPLKNSHLGEAYNDQARELQQFPGEYRLYLVHGQVCMRIGKYREAQELFFKARSCAPPESLQLHRKIRNFLHAIYYQIGKSYIFLKEYSLSHSHLQKSSQLNPKTAAPYYWRCVAYKRNGETDRAIDMAEKGLSIEFGDGLAEQLISLYFHKRDLRKARNLLDRGIRENPKFFNYYNMRAVVFLSARNFEGAKKDLLYVLRHCPDPRLKKQAQQLWRKLPP